MITAPDRLLEAPKSLYWQYHSFIPKLKYRSQMEATFNLTLDDMVQALKSDYIKVYGKIYETPVDQILEASPGKVFLILKEPINP